jgi:hypothetical protein
MEVVGSNGGRVGTIDKVESDRIKLTRKDPQSGGQHRYISVSMVASVDEQVRLRGTAHEAQMQQGHDQGQGESGGFR